MTSFLVQSCFLVLAFIALVIPANVARSVTSPEEDLMYSDYPDLEFPKYLHPVQKRNCLRQGQSCTYRPDACCPNNACRCNVWGANCRCLGAEVVAKWSSSQ